MNLMAAAKDRFFWVKFNASVTRVFVAADAIVDDLRNETHKTFAAQLQATVGRVVDASELVLTANGEVCDPRVPVNTISAELSVTGVCALWCSVFPIDMPTCDGYQ